MQIWRDPSAMERESARKRAYNEKRAAAVREVKANAQRRAPRSKPEHTASVPAVRTDSSVGAISEAARGFKAAIRRAGQAGKDDYKEWKRWRNTSIELLEAAMRLRDPNLERLKVSCLLDPLRKEPRFQAIERQLKFPE